MRSILLLACMASVATAEPTQNREWTDASGKHSLEAEFVEATVTLRLPNGQTKIVDMQKLSEADREFIIKTLHEKNLPVGAPQQPPKQLPQLIEDLKAALASGDKVKVTAATKAVREVDTSCTGVKAIIAPLVRDGDAESIAKTIWVLSEVGTNPDWALPLLWSLQEHVNFPSRTIHIDSGNGVDVEIVFDNDPVVSGPREWDYPLNNWYELSLFYNRSDLVARAGQAEPYREVTRLIAEYAAKDKRVKQMFDRRVAQLKTAPSTLDRSRAALGLSRATALSADVIPALLDSFKKDVSPKVKLAAAVSLAGFGNNAKAAIPAIADDIDSAQNRDAKYILMVSLAQIDPKSGRLRKVISKLLEEYRRSSDAVVWETLAPACNTLGIMGDQCNWAIAQLIETAETGLARGDDGDVKLITMALIAVGGADARVLKFYERAAKDGPGRFRVYCDSVAKQLRTPNKTLR